MAEPSPIDRITELLDTEDALTVNTSMRLPATLRAAAAIAVEELGVAPSTTMLTAAALRSALETAVMAAALETHYQRHPTRRPSLAEVATALAVQDNSPLAHQPDVIERAAAAVVAHRPDAQADDVLLWAQAQAAAGGRVGA